MKPGAPWSIKGVDSDAREVAKAKARAADMTLGQWLNRAIAEADKPQAATPAPAAQPQGSSLDTARLMRAISEVARRVDQVRDTPSAPADSSKLEAAVDSIGRRLTGLERSLAAAADMSGIVERIDAVNGRLEAMESARGQEASPPDLTDDLAPLKTDLQRMMNGMLNLARKIDTVDQRAEERLVPLREQLAARATEVAPTVEPAPQDPRLDQLRDDIQELRQAVETRAGDPQEAAPDIGGAVTAALAPVLAKLADVERQLEQVQKPSVQPVPEPVSVAAPEPDPEFEPEPEPEPAPAPAPTPEFAPEPVASTGEGVEAADSEPEQEELPAEETAEPAGASDTEPGGDQDVPDAGVAGELEDDDAPMQRPAPGAIQALHDLTASRQSVSRRVEPILRDLPTENTSDLDDDDRPDFSAAEEELRADEAPTEAETTARDEQESFAAFREDAATGQPDDATELAPEPRAQEIRGADVDDTDTDIPAAAAPPDRPRRIVPVESLLKGGDGAAPQYTDHETEAGYTGTETMAAAAMDQPAAGMSASGPMAAGHATQDQPRRRRGMGYLVLALIFLAVLAGGFFVIGDPRFNDWVAQGRQAVAALTDMVPVGDEEPSAAPETASASDSTAPPVAVREPVEGTSPAVSAPESSAPQSAAPVDATPTPAPVAPSEPVASPAPEQADAAPAVVAAPPTPAPAPAAPTPAAPASAEDDLAALQARANAGDAAAQFQLGVRYRDGNGVGVSYAEAAQWFQRAAEQGNVPAQVDLGIFYRQGVGVAKDVDLAKVWFHAAARAGHPEAQNFLGQVYVGEEQERPDYFQAARWFREAAEQGVLDAQYNLASLYMGGLGVPRDDAQAYFWFGVAAGQGDQDAAGNQENVAALISPAERAEQDQRIAAFRPVKQFQPASGQATPAVAQPVSGSGEIRRRDQIRLIQRLLIARGYDPGEPDGLPGEQTRDAIRQFETDNAMQVTGKITERVLQALQSGG